MTAEEFVELYKGCRVRVNGKPTWPNVGREGVVNRVNGVLRAYVVMDMDDGAMPWSFPVDRLDIIDELKRNQPLPLPG